MKSSLKIPFSFAFTFWVIMSTTLYGQVSDSNNMEVPIFIDSNHLIRKWVQNQELGQTQEWGRTELPSIQISMESNVLFLEIPTCSCLVKKGEEWFLNNSTSPYSGTCIVMSNNAPKDSLTFLVKRSEYEYSNIFGDNVIPNQGKNHLGEIRIISNYLDGKRHNTRTYYNSNGSLSKIESYKMGKLESTKHYANGDIIRTECN